MMPPSVTVGDERSEVSIRRIKENEAVLVVDDNQLLKGLTIGLLRSIHQAVGAYLALVE